MLAKQDSKTMWIDHCAVAAERFRQNGVLGSVRGLSEGWGSNAFSSGIGLALWTISFLSFAVAACSRFSLSSRSFFASACISASLSACLLSYSCRSFARTSEFNVNTGRGSWRWGFTGSNGFFARTTGARALKLGPRGAYDPQPNITIHLSTPQHILRGHNCKF